MLDWIEQNVEVESREAAFTYAQVRHVQARLSITYFETKNPTAIAVAWVFPSPDEKQYVQ